MVVVPTDALRQQITEKFYTLGILKDPRSVLLAKSVMRPIVGMLLKRPTTVDEVDEFFKICNVVVTTSALAGMCEPEVQARIAELCSHLFFDEAHHAEAPTWKNLSLTSRPKSDRYCSSRRRRFAKMGCRSMAKSFTCIQ